MDAKILSLVAALALGGCARDPLGLSGQYVGDARIDWTFDLDPAAAGAAGSRTEAVVAADRHQVDVEPGTSSDAVLANLPSTFFDGAGPGFAFPCAVPLVVGDAELVLESEVYCDVEVEDVATQAGSRDKRTLQAEWTLTKATVSRGSDRGSLEVFADLEAELTSTIDGEPQGTARLRGEVTFSGVRLAAETR